MSYPQKLSTGGVDKATHRGQYLTRLAISALYLKQYLLFLKAKKDKKNLNTKTAVKNGIALLIVILTVNLPISAAAYNPSIEAYKLYAHMMVGSDKQYRCLVELWDRESNWNPKADNPKSSAYGIPQLLKMRTTNPYRQIELGIKYITKRYGNSCVALARHKRVGHY
ncbi:hypothetical protein UFOVP480_3 [uncultured Caudovirales phage]|uniref:LT_GEWL domain containing protein n=1 Tax=uncultured Caudovirales phage TaxID=2100421 RepID=A0A6J5MFE3_9CAUD|nr:hypothetical protein UFOVP480_3 [uncultured Caudovirales phage]CAB4189909.1 hypothetical protein UFOVP1206_23 [uncultured Caudovirales phage]